MGGRAAALLLLAWGTAAPATADGVCVEIDPVHDNLDADARAAVRIAILDALSREGVSTQPPCTATLVAANLRLGTRIATTITAGAREVRGEASSIDELDLLIRQLVRSLVTGRALATGSGVQDRENVLRDQAAPPRDDPASRRWDTVVGVGGGMLQLPAVGDRPLQRQTNIVSLDGRLWGFAREQTAAFELRLRLLLHDYDVFEAAHGKYEAARRSETNDAEVGWSGAIAVSPLAVANWEVGLGVAKMLGASPPHPYARIGFSASALCRFSDPDHRFDLGLGAYAGLGLQLGDHVGLSIEANVARPFIHGLLETGYAYFLTTTAMVEFRGRSSSPALLRDPPPTIRKITD